MRRGPRALRSTKMDGNSRGGRGGGGGGEGGIGSKEGKGRFC